MIVDTKPEPVTVHFGEQIQPGLLFASDDKYEVCRARGNTFELAFYIVGEGFGTWCLATQENNPDDPVWFEKVGDSPAHDRLREKFA